RRAARRALRRRRPPRCPPRPRGSCHHRPLVAWVTGTCEAAGMITLYDSAISGNSYKVRLAAAQLGVSLRIVPVDILRGESRTAEFLARNPNGRTPVIDDDGFVLAESNAILAYLANGTRLLPEDRRRWALVFQWLFFEQYSHEPYIATSRF